MNFKVCHHCQVQKRNEDFYKDQRASDGLASSCKRCHLVRTRRWQDSHRDKVCASSRKWQLKNKDRVAATWKRYYLRNPIYFTWKNAMGRCYSPAFHNYSYYGGRGIQCLLTLDELRRLWFRDKADLMDRPSLDRIDSDGNYTFDNCRFIELIENVRKAAVQRWHGREAA